MRRLTLLLIAATLVLAASVLATPAGEYKATADDGIRLCPASSSGPILIEVLADGDATIKLVSTSRGNRTWPDDNLGESVAVFELVDGIARPFYVAGDKVDSVYVDVTTATKVLVTWTLAN